MCKFMSAIIRRNGDLICHAEYTDSHETLILAHGLRDDGILGAGGRDWVRVEFTPPGDVSLIADPTKWELRLDETDTPGWWDAMSVRATIESRVERMIVRTDRGCLIGGPWIIVGGRVREVHGRVLHIGPDAKLTGAKLTGANLTGANLTDANLTGANLTGAYLTRAKLTGANLTGANLTGANLTRAKLTGANLDGANLDGANLTDANLTWANLTGAYRLASDHPIPGWTRIDSGVLTRS